MSLPIVKLQTFQAQIRTGRHNKYLSSLLTHYPAIPIISLNNQDAMFWRNYKALLIQCLIFFIADIHDRLTLMKRSETGDFDIPTRSQTRGTDCAVRKKCLLLCVGQARRLTAALCICPLWIAHVTQTFPSHCDSRLFQHSFYLGVFTSRQAGLLQSRSRPGLCVVVG